MTHDLVIRGGDLVDGTGAGPRRGDLAIDGGTITAVGRVDGSGRREIDARGHIVTPGFIDLHTHLDAQIGWDPALTPVCWHGVTTVLMGNCGVTFAPCRASDRGLLAGMMETVENIPREAILEGLPWDWEDYGGYLDSVERLRPGVNVAGLVGHCALRFYVMGERAVEEQATADERRQMADLVGQAIQRGAAGFSTNRYVPHRLPDGRSVPGTFADPEELIEIGRAVGRHDGLLQAVGADGDLLRALARTSGSRVLFSTGAGLEADSGRARRRAFEAMRAEAGDITGLTHVRGSGSLFGLQANLLPIRGEAWARLRRQDLAGRLAAIADPATVARLVEEARRADAAALRIDYLFPLGTGQTPTYTSPDEQSLGALAAAAGEHWSETFLRLSRESGGRLLFNRRSFALNMQALGDLIESEHVFPGLGDAGAHVAQIMDAGWSTFLLAYWVRDAKHYSLGEGVRRLTSGPARVVGLHDRGRLAPGLRADVNVVDLDRVGECQPELVHDFPGGAPRFIQRARGYRATVVNGQVSVVDGELTGERAGMVLRHRGAAAGTH
jgi:N-acyl-D-aspartate/D-glutamate deacylase